MARERGSNPRKRQSSLRLEWLEERCTPSDGDLDLSFGSGGSVTTNFTARFVGSDLGQDVVVQPDGKIIVVGYTSANGTNDFALARYLPNGQLDATFGSGGKVITDFGGNADFALDAILQSDGSIVVAGYAFTGNATGYDFALARYTSSGQLDSSFGVGGKVTTAFAGAGIDQATAVLLQSDGKIVLTGFAATGTTTGTDFAAARYLSNGQLDGSFGVGGKTTIAFANGSTDQASAAVLQSDGKIVLAGVRNSAGNFDFALARLNADGSLDSTFGTAGKVTAAMTSSSHDAAEAVALQADGKIVVAGYSSGPGTYDFSLMRFTPTGVLDTTFDGDGKVTTDFSGGSVDTAYSLAIQADGKIIVAGYTSFQTSPNDLALARYNASGQLDSTFSGDGKVITSVVAGNDQAVAVALQADGFILAAGYASVSGNGNDFALARFVGNSNQPPTANTGGPYTVDEGGLVTLDGSGSSDPNQPADTLVYEWDLDGDGVYGETGAAAANGAETGVAPVFSAANLDGPTTVVVWLRVTDSNGVSHAASTTVDVMNVAPTANAGLDVDVNEGDEVILTGSFSDAGAADTHTLSWKVVDEDGNVVVETSGASVSFTALDNGTYFATFTVVDDDGASASDRLTVTSANLAPTASIHGPTLGAPGQPLTFALAATDPGPADEKAPFTYLVDWGDGTSPTSVSGPGSGVSVQHAFAKPGSYTIQVTAVDKDGAASAAVTWNVTVQPVYLQDDPLNPGKTMLVVAGTANRDHIVITGHGKHGDVRVRLNGSSLGRFEPTSRIVVYGNAGNDFIVATGHVEVPVWLYGGEGNDFLFGGSGPSILDGGAGNDMLMGGAGRSILIGGHGKDVLHGGGNDDILVADSLPASDEALFEALDVWNSKRDWDWRVKKLEELGSFAGVVDDHVSDRLIGVTQRDWVVTR